jgi:hypothetical protein
MIQDIFTLLLVFACAAYFLYSFYKVLFPVKGKAISGCTGCSGCRETRSCTSADTM